MPDHFGATIRIWPWRNDDAATHAVADWLTARYGAIQLEDGTEMLEAPMVSRRGTLSLEIAEAQEGINEFTEAGPDPLEEPSFVGLLQMARLSFEARDTRGREISWRAGLDEVRKRSLLADGSPALSQELAEEFLLAASGDALRGALRNYFAPIDDHLERQVERIRTLTETVVCEGESGAPSVIYASAGAEVLVIPAFREDEHDVYGPQDVLDVVAEIEALRGFPSSNELRDLVEELRKTARTYVREA